QSLAITHKKSTLTRVFSADLVFMCGIIRRMSPLERPDQSGTGSGTGPEDGSRSLEWVLGASPSAAFAASADGCVFFLNAAARARWPWAAPGSLVSSLFPEAARAELDAIAADVIANGTPGQFECGEHGPAGVREWERFALSPLRAQGEANAFLCIASDITELKCSEQQLRRSEQLMVDTQGVAHLGTWEWDISAPTAVWSHELYRIYGLTPDTYTPSYENYLAMVHPDDRQRVMDATNRVFHEHLPYSHDERIFRPDGSLRYLHTWAHPVLDDAGKLVRLVGVCQDITDQKLAEAQVVQLNLDLEQRVAERTRTIESSLRDVEAFNAMVSHDLRAPLQVISMGCQLILRDTSQALPASVSEHLSRVQRSVKYMTELVNDLLALAHVGNAPLTRTEVDLSALSEEIVTNLRRLSNDREATVEIEPGLRCRADQGLMRSAMENLLGNAWKYSSRVSHARIAVGGVLRDGRKQFFVRDNGAGFEMKDASRLFKPFERLHKASEFAGTGVGLAVVHRIIERHGGHIHAQGQLGEGALFTFDLGP
ncbi:MAG: ATP-binding protein, partial [Nitrobacter sp.]